MTFVFFRAILFPFIPLVLPSPVSLPYSQILCSLFPSPPRLLLTILLFLFPTLPSSVQPSLIISEKLSQRKSSISQLTTHFLTHKCSRLFKRRNALKSPADLINLKPKDFLLEREVRVAKMVLIRVLLFCLAWTPYVIVILLTQFTKPGQL